MKIQDVLICGKPFKRKDWDFWAISYGGRVWYWKEKPIFPLDITNDDIMATDWIINKSILIAGDGKIFKLKEVKNDN